MKRKVEKLYSHVKWIEIGIAALLIITLIILTSRMVLELSREAHNYNTSELLEYVFSNAFLLVIYVEFIKMIIKPTSENVLEVIMLTIARSLIMDHSSMANSLFGILGMLILFIIRKFFFCEMQGEKEEASNAIKPRKVQLKKPSTNINLSLSRVSYDVTNNDNKDIE